MAEFYPTNVFEKHELSSMKLNFVSRYYIGVTCKGTTGLRQLSFSFHVIDTFGESDAIYTCVDVLQQLNCPN